MNGTIDSTGGLRRITRMSEPLRRRVAAFVLVVALGALVIAWIDANIWRRMAELERSFAAVRTERFYHALHLQATLRHLSDELLRFQLKGKDSDLVGFREDAEELRQWISARQAEAATIDERELFEQLARDYEVYLQASADLRDLQKRPFLLYTRGKLDEVRERLRQNSAPLLELCEKLMDVQRQAFGAFLKDSQTTLDSFQHLIKFSLILLFLLALSLVAVVYRGMITPLRLELTQSRVIIERQEKLAALGGLAAGVAHEIRNPLTAIKFRLFSLRKSLPPTESENEDATVIANEINRLERIVKDFLQFARPSEPDLVHVPALRMVEEVRELLRGQLEKASIQLAVEVIEDVWVRADPQQIKQVLINLIQNAAETISRNGTITLRIRSDQTPLPGGRGPVAVIEVEDTGKGIPPEVQKRLFDPFFTTKEGGTGLGLPIAARIVEKHGGDLRYQTQMNRGTTFRILLPRVTQHES
jgi:signal transduction histidine kinase